MEHSLDTIGIAAHDGSRTDQFGHGLDETSIVNRDRQVHLVNDY